jgi:hypothetical protein
MVGGRLLRLEIGRNPEPGSAIQEAKAPSFGSEARNESNSATATERASVKPRTTMSRRISSARGE